MKIIAAALVASAATFIGVAEAATWKVEYDVVSTRIWFDDLRYYDQHYNSVLVPPGSEQYEYALREGHYLGKVQDVTGRVTMVNSDDGYVSITCTSGYLCPYFSDYSTVRFVNANGFGKYNNRDWTATFSNGTGVLRFFDDAFIGGFIAAPDGVGTLIWWAPQGTLELANVTVTEVPVPASAGLLAACAAFLAAIGRRRFRAEAV